MTTWLQQSKQRAVKRDEVEWMARRETTMKGPLIPINMLGFTLCEMGSPWEVFSTVTYWFMFMVYVLRVLLIISQLTWMPLGIKAPNYKQNEW